MKSGFVSLIGRPNVGKSTLLNAIIGTKLSIISDKPQTTRNQIYGIYNESDTQIIFVDTPGIHKPLNKLGKNLNDQAYYSVDDVDLILFLVDAHDGLGRGDTFIIERLKEVSKPVILLINKIDLIPKPKILEIIKKYNDLYPFSEIIPISAEKKDNLKPVIEMVKKYLNNGPKYYSDDEFTNVSTKFIISEYIREKVLKNTKEEVPHTVTCIVEEFKEKKDVVSIISSIIVERESVKGIIIGKQGSMIKSIGIEARYDIEKFLGKKVYLELFVKVIPNWRDKEKYLKEFGLSVE